MGKVASSDPLWRKYFASIKQVCPWSSKYMDNILVWENNQKCLSTIACLFPATKFEAFVFVYKDKSAKQLEKLADKMNNKYTHSEFLWSHPLEGGDSTHVPCLIQQDRAKLTNIREKIGYVDEIEKI